MRFIPTTKLPLDCLKTSVLLDTLQELTNLHESAMLNTTRVFLEQEMSMIHGELDSRDEIDAAWGQERPMM